MALIPRLISRFRRILVRVFPVFPPSKKKVFVQQIRSHEVPYLIKSLYIPYEHLLSYKIIIRGIRAKLIFTHLYSLFIAVFLRLRVCVSAHWILLYRYPWM
ncbi:hypothetical protein GDO81_016287 [Engystomops pustulosus]|uniref:Uncharacterized protein n=1 Tax=Engystomops pustulosus TaxID=76066 RepID=A0AAV7ARW8_ENGPU|nr:hypothetical protein GDO81_016287 [Engystomops pustulosus]